MRTSWSSADSVAAPSTGRLAGLACICAGVSGAISGVCLTLAEPHVPESRFSYPATATAFVVVPVWFCVQHLGLLAGQVGLRSCGAAGPRTLARWGHGIAITGMALLTLTEAVAIAAAEETRPTAMNDPLDGMYGLASLSIGAGMVVAGLEVRRRRVWNGWRSGVPLIIGLWVFVPMMPAIMLCIAMHLASAAWMLLFAALGWALAAPATEPAA